MLRRIVICPPCTGFGGLKSLILARQAKLGYFLIAGVNTHSLVFTRHASLSVMK